HAGGLVHRRNAGLEISESLGVVALQHLQMCVDHPVICGQLGIAEAADRLTCRRTQVPVRLAPTVVPEPGTAGEHLGAGVEEGIAAAGAELHGSLDGGDSAVRIDEAERPDQATQCLDLCGCEAVAAGPTSFFLRGRLT